MAALEAVGLDRRVERDPHLAAAREDVDRAVVVVLQERPVGVRGLGELVDLLTQRGDVLLCLLEGVAELLVVGKRLGELAFHLERPPRRGGGPEFRSCRHPYPGTSSLGRPDVFDPTPTPAAADPRVGASLTPPGLLGTVRSTS